MIDSIKQLGSNLQLKSAYVQGASRPACCCVITSALQFFNKTKVVMCNDGNRSFGEMTYFQRSVEKGDLAKMDQCNVWS